MGDYTFRDTLINAVKDAAQELIDRAEDIVGEPMLLSSMCITIDFDSEFDMRMPEINVSKTFYSKRCEDRFIHGEQEEK